MNCRVCNSKNLELAIDLGYHPWGNHFLKKEEVGKEPFYPLRVVQCQDCKTAQLDYTVKKEVMFGDHTYRSGMTKTLSNHFKRLAEEVDDRFFKNAKGKSALDIGSNDGTQLKHYQKLGYEVLGVESSKTIAQIANEETVPTLNQFFNLDLAREIGRKFHVINAAGIFFHLEELHSFTNGLKECLREDGVFVVQFLYMRRIVENLAFDQIYHEHLLYYNFNTVEVLLDQHGLALFDAYESPIHGGSVMGFVGHKDRNHQPSERLKALKESEISAGSNELQTYREFAKRIETLRKENLNYLNKAKEEGKTIFGMGAPVKGNTLLNYFGVSTNHLKYLVEINEMRRGMYSPGMHIPIVIEKELTETPEIYYVLAWNFKKEILSKNRDLIEKGVEFYFPINPKGA